MEEHKCCDGDPGVSLASAFITYLQQKEKIPSDVCDTYGMVVNVGPGLFPIDKLRMLGTVQQSEVSSLRIDSAQNASAYLLKDSDLQIEEPTFDFSFQNPISCSVSRTVPHPEGTCTSNSFCASHHFEIMINVSMLGIINQEQSTEPSAPLRGAQARRSLTLASSPKQLASDSR